MAFRKQVLSAFQLNWRRPKNYKKIEPLETIKQVYRVDRKEISYLRFIFEGYDGIAAIKTIDPQKGIICLFIPPACKNDAEMILTHLKKELLIERLSPDAFTSEDLEP